MELMTQKRTLNTKKILNTVYVCISLTLLIKLGLVINTKYAEYQVVRKNTICPALLSMSRGARDTLIVMKAENLCNQYVLETLK